MPPLCDERKIFMSKTVVAVLFGGCSTEYEVSLQSAYAVLTHLDARRYSVLTVGITRQGEWLYYNGALERILCSATLVHSLRIKENVN